MTLRTSTETHCESCGAKGELRWSEIDPPDAPPVEKLVGAENLRVSEIENTPFWRGRAHCSGCGAVVFDTED